MAGPGMGQPLPGLEATGGDPVDAAVRAFRLRKRRNKYGEIGSGARYLGPTAFCFTLEYFGSCWTWENAVISSWTVRGFVRHGKKQLMRFGQQGDLCTWEKAVDLLNMNKKTVDPFWTARGFFGHGTKQLILFGQ